MASTAEDLDPQIRQFQREIAAGYAAYPDFGALPFPERRRVAERIRAPWCIGGPAMRSVSELRVGDLGVRIRINRPVETRKLPALVYLHGGGWTLFGIETHDRLMREYAARAGIAVIGVEYSLAPEARFPVALEEVLSVIAWLRANARAEGIDSGRILIGEIPPVPISPSRLAWQ